MMLLATDLDRTLLPNGPEPYDNSLPLLLDTIKEKGLKLAYVSGMNLDLLTEAFRKYKITIPDYFIAEVGTVMYQKTDNKLVIKKDWQDFIKNRDKKWGRKNILSLLEDRGLMDKLEFQEGWKQNGFKISFYLNDMDLNREITDSIEDALEKGGIFADVLYSVDPLKNTGLIDILPKAATKVSALEFVRKELGLSKEEVIYCGDSGNDILPLTNGYKSILVNNAPKTVKEEVISINESKGFSTLTYVASGKDGLNGNYSSGILEGLRYFRI